MKHLKNDVATLVRVCISDYPIRQNVIHQKMHCIGFLRNIFLVIKNCPFEKGAYLKLQPTQKSLNIWNSIE